MENPFEELVEACRGGDYSPAQIRSLAHAFNALDNWFDGDYMGKSGKEVNPKILVGYSRKDEYKLLANLLVFLKKYYLPEQQPQKLYRIHYLKSSELKEKDIQVGGTLPFKSLGSLSSWSTNKNQRTILGRKRIPGFVNIVLTADMPKENILWSTLTTQLFLKSVINERNSDSQACYALVAYIRMAKNTIRKLVKEQEFIVMLNKPITAKVIEIFR